MKGSPVRIRASALIQSTVTKPSGPRSRLRATRCEAQAPGHDPVETHGLADLHDARPASNRRPAPTRSGGAGLSARALVDLHEWMDAPEVGYAVRRAGLHVAEDQAF